MLPRNRTYELLYGIRVNDTTNPYGPTHWLHVTLVRLLERRRMRSKTDIAIDGTAMAHCAAECESPAGLVEGDSVTMYGSVMSERAA